MKKFSTYIMGFVYATKSFAPINRNRSSNTALAARAVTFTVALQRRETKEII